MELEKCVGELVESVQNLTGAVERLSQVVTSIVVASDGENDSPEVIGHFMLDRQRIVISKEDMDFIESRLPWVLYAKEGREIKGAIQSWLDAKVNV